MTTNNMYLGDNELVIVFRNGTHCVLEKYEDYDAVFTGNYAKCVDYCEKRRVSYLESLY